MPIRFRCQHCQQLMGIARRKAGTKVQCPTCHENVVVPNEDEVPAAPQPSAAKAGDPAPLFERSDFDEVLRGSEAPRALRPAPKNGGAGPRSFPHDVDPVGTSNGPASVSSLPAATGIILSSRRATLLAVAGIVLLALAFGAGLLVGRYCF